MAAGLNGPMVLQLAMQPLVLLTEQEIVQIQWQEMAETTAQLVIGQMNSPAWLMAAGLSGLMIHQLVMKQLARSTEQELALIQCPKMGEITARQGMLQTYSLAWLMAAGLNGLMVPQLAMQQVVLLTGLGSVPIPLQETGETTVQPEILQMNSPAWLMAAGLSGLMLPQLVMKQLARSTELGTVPILWQEMGEITVQKGMLQTYSLAWLMAAGLSGPMVQLVTKKLARSTEQERALIQCPEMGAITARQGMLQICFHAWSMAAGLNGLILQPAMLTLVLSTELESVTTHCQETMGLTVPGMLLIGFHAWSMEAGLSGPIHQTATFKQVL